MLSPLKRNFYLSIIFLILTVPISISAWNKADCKLSAISSQEEDILVSELYQFLESETDLGWQKQFATVNYTKLIDNYKVRILWIPRDEAPLNYISGPGIIEFTDETKVVRFTIKCIDLAFSAERMLIDSSDIRKSILNKTIELEYEQPTIENRFDGNITEPFFFYDTDFDDEIELIVTQFGYGVQNSNTYRAYKLNDSGLENDSKQTTNIEPFSLLNDFTEFNKLDNTVTIGRFFGGGETQSSIYKKINPSEFKLVSIIKYTFEEMITFELVDGEIVEVKREKVNETVK